MADPTPINFTRGVPASESFPAAQLASAAENALRKHSSTILQYGPASGFLPMREWLAARYNVAVDNVLCSNGSLQIVEFLGAALLAPGDTVFVEEPSYDRTLTTLRKAGARVVGIALQADGPDIDALEQALRIHHPRFFYVIPDFQNPSGATCSRAKRQRLVELAHAHNFFLLEDCPYRPLRYSGQAEPALIEMAPDVVLLMSSYSKLIGPGPRFGFAIGDAGLLQRLAKVAEDTYISPGLLAHGIVYEYCAAGYLEPQVERLLALYAPRLAATLAALDKHLPETEPTRPQGGFFLSLTLPDGVNTSDVRTAAARVGLNLADGRGFFSNGGGERFLRLQYCALSPADLEEGIKRLAGVVHALQA